MASHYVAEFLFETVCAKQKVVYGREESPENSGVQRKERPNPEPPGSNVVFPIGIP